jgi:hypothetical protein
MARELTVWLGFAVLFPLMVQRHATGAFMGLLYATGALQDPPQAAEREALARHHRPPDA